MIRYIARRLLQAIPTVFGITVLSFLIMTAAPGGPTAALTQDPHMTPQKLKAISASLGLNESWPSQYLRWLIGDDWRLYDSNGDGVLYTQCETTESGEKVCNPDHYGQRLGILRLDFGFSYAKHRSVLALITERAGATLELGTISLVFGTLIGILIGIFAAVRRGGWFDNITRVLAVVFSAVPIFWLGLMLILIFSVTLHLVPLGGRCDATTTCPPVYDRLNYLILPAFVLATGEITGYSRYMRATMLDVINQDYIRTAQAKGMSNRGVWFVHAARNALIPVATFLGPAITGLLGGAFVTERVFQWPGLGTLALSALTTLDYPVIMATVLLGAFATILGFILSDILYAVIDPRIRFS
jgi:peptide/nickel transport system permease protein